MGFVVGATALFIGAGAIPGWFVGTVLIRALSSRVRAWALRLLLLVSLLPLLLNVDHVQSQAMAELGQVSAVGTFVTVSLLIILVAIVGGWILCSFYLPLVPAVPAAALVVYYHLALRNVLWREGFWQDNVTLVWLFIYEAGATGFLFFAGWLVWRARESHRLTCPSTRHG